MQTKSLRRLAAIALAMVGNVALAQSGWVEMASTGSGGLKNLPLNGTYDANIAQASWAHQGGRGPFLSWVSTYSGNPQWNMVVPMDDGSLWRSADGGQTLTCVFPAASAPANARPQHAVRLPNGALYVAFAPTSNDVGLYCNASFTFTQPDAPLAFDPRYKVLRSGDDGATWEDTGLSTINGISAAGSQVEVNWGGWQDSSNTWKLADLGIWTWTDRGIGNPWSSITVNADQTQVGISFATMPWTEIFRSGGTATDNYLGSTLTSAGMYATATIWNKPTGLLGCGALLAGPVEFDFAAGRVIFGSSGERSVLQHDPEIPVAWDRSGKMPCLRVALVGHGTLLERAGAHVGDQVIRAGDLKGTRLTREALLTLLQRNPEPGFTFAHRAKS